MRSKITSNKKLWNELTTVHLKGSNTYPINAFRRGKNVLHQLELNEIGDVSGKSILHLHCHFGLDSLSWTRLGAKVTGVDFSDCAIHAARKIADECNLKAKFIISDIYTLPEKLNKKFDFVFASYGILYWIPDIQKWMRVASGFLKNGGIFYLVDGHPIYNWLNRDETKRNISEYPYSYFDRKTQRHKNCSDYADPAYKQKLPEYGWHYTVSDLINSAINAGLEICCFNEFSSFNIKKQGKTWKPVTKGENFPVMFSLKAKKCK